MRRTSRSEHQTGSFSQLQRFVFAPSGQMAVRTAFTVRCRAFSVRVMNLCRHWIAATLAAWLLPGTPSALPQNPPVPGESATLIRDGLVIDVLAIETVPQTDILIKNGRIAAIGKTGTLTVPAGAVTVEASGKVIIPGIINARGLAGFVQSPRRPQDHFQRDEVLAQLGTYASYGVTTISTLGPDGSVLAEIRKAIGSELFARVARAVTPIRALAMSTPRAARFPAIRPAFEIVESPAAGRQAVDRLIAEGADLIEFLADADSGKRGDPGSVSTAVLKRAAHHGKRVMVVVPSEASATRLVLAGARIVAGSITDTDVSDAFVRLLLKSNVVYAPALTAESVGFEYGDDVPWLDDRFLRRSLQPGIVGTLRGPIRMQQALDPDRALKLRRFDTARRNLRRIHAASVEIGFASTSGFPGTFQGYSDYREAVLMNRAGMPTMSVIRAFSIGSATALGMEGQRGALCVGCLADLVILNANPLDNIHNLREIHAVLIGGRLSKL